MSPLCSTLLCFRTEFLLRPAHPLHASALQGVHADVTPRRRLHHTSAFGWRVPSASSHLVWPCESIVFPIEWWEKTPQCHGYVRWCTSHQAPTVCGRSQFPMAGRLFLAAFVRTHINLELCLELCSGSSQGVHENATHDAKQTSMDLNVARSVQACTKRVDLDAIKTHNGRNAVERCASFAERAIDGGRKHKSAELSLNGGLPPGTRLHKSGEQFSSKPTVSARNPRESSTSGPFNLGNVQVEGYGFAEALSAIGGSPTASKDGRRWPSFGSQGSTDSMGGSPTAKDGGRRSSFSNGGSSDGGSPMAKDIWRRSSTGGYGSADSSSSSVGSPTIKDVSRRIASSSVLNDKELSPCANLRGMGNIFGGGNIKNSTNKPNANDSSKSGDVLVKKLDSAMQLNRKDCSQVKGCLGNSFNGNIGNICANNVNGFSLVGNLPSNANSSQKPMGCEDNGTSHELNSPEDIKRAGNEQYKMGHFLEAAALYDKCIALSPDHAPYKSNKAAALAGLGKLVEAVQECEDAIRLDSKYSRALHRAAQLYLRLGLIESSRRRFQAAGLQDDARDVQSLQAVEKHISRCIDARKMGDWKSVLRESMAASTAGADSAPQVLGYKSEALLKLHRPEEAEIVCTEAERLEKSVCTQGFAPSDSFLSILRAHIEMSLGRFDTAIVAAQTAAKIDPRNPEVAGLLKKARAVGQTRTSGNELFNAGKFFEACAAYGEGLESDPTNAVLLCNRAACRSKLGQWEKALEDCDAALNSQPQYVKALMRRANCSLKLERWEDALRDYEVLRVKMPGDIEVSRGLFDAQVAIKKARGEEIHQMRFGGEVEEVLDSERFRDVVSSEGMSVVQFSSKRADRCRQICSFFDQLCKRYPCVHFVKVDVDESPDVGKTYAVSSIPTFRIYKNGHKMKELVSPSQQDLEFAVRQYN
ncbi:hypothetical protein GOP47_0015446 [Adiantum capillus-veneris]|uniref:Thioredoxin domain-containing protein n=1 Tax=Adiantum capillus-veneris TaxID=13818 RepID=A0A9D4ZD74_ADICA|nr:hypothetical protein GOP47_0015446 [Adiantum capillus-veneris]